MPKSKKNIHQFNDELLKGAFRTPKANKKTKVALSDRRKFEEAIVKNIIATEKIQWETSIDYDEFEKYEIGCYLTEAIALIINAKKIKKIELPSPFGDFSLSSLSTNNYIVKIKGVSMEASTYENLLNLIDGFKYKSRLIYRLKDFFGKELSHEFYIDISSPEKIKSELYKNMKIGIRPADFRGLEDKVNIQLKSNKKSYTISYKQAGALMCGIFMAEIIRSSGKIIRAAFLHDKWPSDYKKLCETLIQADKGGNRELRNFVQNSAKVSSKTRQAAANIVKNFSPSKSEVRRKLNFK